MHEFDHPPSPSIAPPRGSLRWAPGLTVLRQARWADVRRDLVAGVVLTAFLVPVGAGYAQAAGLPPITGLYSTIAAMVAYALLGPSRVLVLGPDASLAARVAVVVAPLAHGDPVRAVALAGLLAVLAGLGIAAAGLLRFGFLTELLSRPVQLGYLSGVGVLILAAQVPKLLGLSLTSPHALGAASELVGLVAAGQASGSSLALGGGTLALLALGKRFAPRAPWPLVAVVLGVALVEALGLADRVKVLGSLPRGVPPFSPPVSVLSELPLVFGAALGLALVTIADTSILARAIANQRDEEPRPDQELVAIGAANVLAGLFGGFPVAASSSRTPVAMAAGARTHATGLVGAACVLGLIVVAPNLLASLPQPVLSGIVVLAAVGLLDATGVRRLFRARRSEGIVWAVTVAAVTTIGVLEGIFLAVVLSLGDFVRRAIRPHDAVLGRVDGQKGYHDVARHPSARRIPGLVLYRFDAPLFFANAGTFRDRLRQLARLPGTRRVVVAAEPITDVDTTAADMLADVRADLEQKGVRLVFAELKGPTKDRLRAAGVYELFGDESFFPTVGTAVDAYLDDERVEWVDWDER